MPVGLERRLRIIQVIVKPICPPSRGTMGIVKVRLIQWARRKRTPSGFMTCTEMFGNGVKTTGSKTTTPNLRKRIRKVRIRVPFVCCVAVRGTTISCAVGRPAATGTIRAAAKATSSVFGWWCLRSGLRDSMQKRRWFQIHLSTAIVLMFVVGVLLWANTVTYGAALIRVPVPNGKKLPFPALHIDALAMCKLRLLMESCRRVVGLIWQLRVFWPLGRTGNLLWAASCPTQHLRDESLHIEKDQSWLANMLYHRK